MSHQHQGMQLQGIPQLPQYDPKLLQNAPKELMRGLSYPAQNEEPFLQGIEKQFWDFLNSFYSFEGWHLWLKDF